MNEVRKAAINRAVWATIEAIETRTPVKAGIAQILLDEVRRLRRITEAQERTIMKLESEIVRSPQDTQ